MSTFYVDHINGNDASAGTSWGTAWKTITNGATAARIAPADVIKIAKSPDPVNTGVNATFTNLSRTVTLASAVTQNIDLCETAWTPSANVTANTNGERKEGATSATLTVASGFTTGKIGYKATGVIDLSAYQQICFWIKTSSVAVVANNLTLRLCSDTIGDTVVHTIPIPALAIFPSNIWYPIVWDNGSALSSSIQSVSLSATIDPGTPTIFLDNIFASKAPSSADAITLNSLIGKSSNATIVDTDEPWCSIKCINGTEIEINNYATSYGTGRGYYGVTETVPLYRRETIKTVLATASSTQIEIINDSGTAGNLIEYSGGWDTGTDTRDGETILDGQNGNGYGLYASGKSYIKTSHIGGVNYNQAVGTAGTASDCDFSVPIASNCSTGIVWTPSLSQLNVVQSSFCAGQDVFISAYGSTVTAGNLLSSATSGLRLNNADNSFVTIKNTSNNVYGLGLSNTALFGVTINEIQKSDANNFHIYTEGTQDKNKINKVTSSNAAGAFANVASSSNLVINKVTSTNDPLIAQGYTAFKSSFIAIDDYNGNAAYWEEGVKGTHRTSTITNGSGKEWYFTFDGAGTQRTVTYPFKFPVARVAVNANALVTASIWVKKSDATAMIAKLVCRGMQVSGVDTDVVATATNTTDEQQLTITFTPTENKVIELEIEAYETTGSPSLIIDAMSISQA